jgi:cell migration-inducing and hyaluronan-binding protein
MHVYKNLKVADNAIGYTHASGNAGRSAFTSRVVDSRFVGESENIGNPRTPAEMAYGRSLPEPNLPDFPIRGYEFYDYHHELDNDTFVNFEDNATRKTGAISYLLYTSFGMSSNNTIQRAKFINAKPVYFPPMERKWSNDDYGNGSYQTAVFHDQDGSVSGVPNSYILINDANDVIAIDEACEIKSTWNAAVCKGDVGRMTVGGGGGGGRGAGGGGRGGAPAAAGPGGRGGAAVAGGPGAAAGAGGRGAVVVGPRVGFLGARAPAGPPVVLSRNGKELSVTGETNVRAGTEIKVTTERPSLSLSVKELDSGSWVIFELPGFTTAASGTEQSSLDALRKASATSYYKGNGSLWVKLVSTGDVLGSGPDSGPSGGASLQASR